MTTEIVEVSFESSGPQQLVVAGVAYAAHGVARVVVTNVKLVGITRKPVDLLVQNGQASVPASLVRPGYESCHIEVAEEAINEAMMATHGIIDVVLGQARKPTMSMPADLQSALDDFDVGSFDPRELRHMISMVREAKDPIVRAARISEIVDYVQNG